MDYKINNDFFDEFPVLFTGQSSILADTAAPLGSHAAEALDADTTLWTELTLAVRAFRIEFDTFLHARSPTAAALAQERLDRLWTLLVRLPVYRLLHTKPSAAGTLIARLQSCPQEMDELLTPGTERHRAITRWLGRLDNLIPSLQVFRRDVSRMLDEHFAALPSRRPTAYAEAYGAWRFLLADVLEQEEDEHDVSTAAAQPLRFPVRLSWEAYTDAAGHTQLAERMYFEDLS
ncbi:MAG: hypothetical protein IJF59_02660, partial [Clostridia bacterium]|nr:hypothetical protein [Clostridia bacterium]